MKNKILIFICFLFLITSVSAVTTYQENSEFEIIHPIRMGGGIPPVNTNCNISVFYSNNTALIDNQPMNNKSLSHFNYTINTSQSTPKGLYDYDITCISGDENVTQSFDYLINLGGVEPSQQRTDTLTRTIWIFFLFAVLLFISLFFVKNLPIKATIFLVMIWFMIIGINTTFITLQDEVVNTSIESFFSFFLVISFWINYLIFFSIVILWILTFFINVFNFKERKKQQRFDP